MPPSAANSATPPASRPAGDRVMVEPGARVKVLIPLPLDGAYDYRLPIDMAAEIGSFVVVPLGNRLVAGVIWAESVDSDVPEDKLREIAGLLEVPPLPKANRAFVEWLAAYYLSPPGNVLRMAMSVASALEPPTTRPAYRRADVDLDALEIRPTAARKRVLEAASDGFAHPASELASMAGVSSSVIKGLAEAGALEVVQIPDEARWTPPDPNLPGPDLSGDQKAAADQVAAAADDGFSVTLLDGVTGSGKTEVYFEAIAETLAAGKQVLVLLPEIALSSQWLARFEQRFGAAPAEWHSDLTQGQRRRTWRGIAEGRARIVVGARSALHLPYPELGLIVVDEEHETAFKQEDGVAYHARDMAVLRARLAEIPIILVSATPSLESLLNAKEGRYRLLHLPERHAGATMPTVELIDITKDKPGRQQWLTPTLRKALEDNLAAGEQSLLFLNRRGYAPLTLCRTCGHRLACPNCSAWLVEHRFTRSLQCHHCGFTTGVPKHCPSCDDTDSFAACGPGVERMLEEATLLLPDARIEVVTSDTIRGPLQAAAFVDRMEKGEIDVVIGTQIVAKGYHFPRLTLVGVVDADLGLNGGDLRAGERTYQLMYQVAGRAGREGLPGRVMLQTASPTVPVMQALARHDRDGFLEAELRMREEFDFPPFGRLAALIVSGQDEGLVDRVAQALGRAAPHGKGLTVLGPAPAPLALLRGRYRRRLLLKTSREVSVQKVLADWLGKVQIPNPIRLQVDVDPYSFL